MRDSDRVGGKGRMGSVELTTVSSLDFSASPQLAQPLECGEGGSRVRGGSQKHFSFQWPLVGRAELRPLKAQGPSLHLYTLLVPLLSSLP